MPRCLLTGRTGVRNAIGCLVVTVVDILLLLLLLLLLIIDVSVSVGCGGSRLMKTLKTPDKKSLIAPILVAVVVESEERSKV